MKKLRVYLDASVINFMFAVDAPEKMDLTIRFFADYLLGGAGFITFVFLTGGHKMDNDIQF